MLKASGSSISGVLEDLPIGVMAGEERRRQGGAHLKREWRDEPNENLSLGTKFTGRVSSECWGFSVPPQASRSFQLKS